MLQVAAVETPHPLFSYTLINIPLLTTFSYFRLYYLFCYLSVTMDNLLFQIICIVYKVPGQVG